MAKKRKKPASKGSVNKVILKTLLTGKKYGYEIIKEVEEYTNGKVVLKQPSLYSSLSRFELKGYVTSYWEDSAIGGRRHYYSLTPLGKKYYNETFTNEKTEDIEDEDTIDININIANDKEQEIQNKPFIDNSKITNDNFNIHIQNKIQSLLETDEDKDNVSKLNESHASENFTQNNNETLALSSVSNREDIKVLNDTKIGEVVKTKHNEYQTVLNNYENNIKDGNIKEIVAEEDLNEMLIKMQDKSTAKEDVLKSTAKLAEQVAKFKNTYSMPKAENEENESNKTNEDVILDAEIIEEVSNNNVHVNAINMLDSYKDFSYKNPTPTDNTGEVSNRIKEIKSLYDEIKTQSSKMDAITNIDSDNTRKPLTLLEQQRRQASMEKLYGSNINMLPEKSSINQINENVEKINILSPDFKIQKEDNDNFQNFKSSLKANNFKLSKLSKIFHLKKHESKTNDTPPNNSQKFYIDENGITKLQNNSTKKTNTVIDNVIYRNDNYNNNIGTYKEVVKPAPAPAKITSPIYRKEIQLTAEEREEKIKQFDKRFQNLTNNQIEKKKSALSTLNILQNLHNTKETRTNFDSPSNQVQQHTSVVESKTRYNNFPNYTNKEDPVVFESNNDLFNHPSKQQSTEQPTQQLAQQPIQQPMQEEEIKMVEQTTTKRVEVEDKPNSILNLQRELQEKNLSFKSYSNEDYFNQPDIKFLLSNKVKFIFGWIILFLMLIELSSFIFILNRLELLHPEDFTILRVSFAVIIFIALANILPYFLNKNKRKSNNFNLTHSFLFGLFAFFLVAIITYAINTLIGFDLENINFYLVKLIIPLILALNFVISPFIYKFLLNRKAFY